MTGEAEHNDVVERRGAVVAAELGPKVNGQPAARVAHFGAAARLAAVAGSLLRRTSELLPAAGCAALLIAKAMLGVSPEGHAAEVIEALPG